MGCIWNHWAIRVIEVIQEIASELRISTFLYKQLSVVT